MGDAAAMSSNAAGGNDRLFGDDGDDRMYGDAISMLGATRGGNDRLDGGNGNDLLYGDARQFSSLAHGGNDRLAGGAGNDLIYGDAAIFGSRAQGGDDRLNGGTGDDTLFGGGGHDLFSFSASSGHDTVRDFDPASLGGANAPDTIDLRGLGFASFGDVLAATNDNGSGFAVITLSAGNDITLNGVAKADLTAPDFLF
jgi:Ca2+-binding RTX toxin-like protein